MCGPSDEMKKLTKQLTQFSKQTVSEAGQIFGDASQVFNNIMNSVQSIVTGGPSQMGYSQAELNTLNSQAIESGATMARNLKGAAATSAAAIGGGNSSQPSGATATATSNADIAAARATASAEQQITVGGFEAGRENYWKAIGAEQQAPGVFDSSTRANEAATSAQSKALEAQTTLDSQSNWWANDIMQLGSAAVGGFTSGLGAGMMKSQQPSAPAPSAPAPSASSGGSSSSE